MLGGDCTELRWRDCVIRWPDGHSRSNPWCAWSFPEADKRNCSLENETSRNSGARPLHNPEREFLPPRDTVRAARLMALNSISFLAADLSSAAFNHTESWPEERRSRVALNPHEVERLADEVEALIYENQRDIEEGFIVESPSKLWKIVRHFRAQIGQCSPLSPSCNAPWV